LVLSTLTGAKGRDDVVDKMLSYRRETALQGTLVLAESGRLELGQYFTDIVSLASPL